jgi:uncharacterized protein
MIRTFTAVAALSLMAADPGYVAGIEKWRQESEERLKAPAGWLSVAGLFWLKPGPNRFGSAADNDIVLPASAPPYAGTFVRDGFAVRLESKQPDVRVNNVAAGNIPLVDDGNGTKDPTIVRLGTLSMTVIPRGEKVGIRLRDTESKYRREFTHRSWFPVKPELRVEAKFLPYATAKKIILPTVIDGYREEQESPGQVEFMLGGQKHRLEMISAGKQLWLIFKDKSAGKHTYPAGRFLYTDLPVNGKVFVDFNKAYNPPCAFTPWATCPLPKKENVMKVAVEAGELNFHTEP